MLQTCGPRLKLQRKLRDQTCDRLRIVELRAVAAARQLVHSNAVLQVAIEREGIVHGKDRIFLAPDDHCRLRERSDERGVHAPRIAVDVMKHPKESDPIMRRVGRPTPREALHGASMPQP